MGWAALFANVWARRAAMVAGALLVLFMAAKYFEHKGSVQGRQDMAQEVANQIEQRHQADRAELAQQLAPALAAASAAEQKAATANQLLLAVLSQRSAATAQVAGMNDAQVSAAVRKEIGDLALPEVQRQILACKTQLPLCEQEAAAARQKADENGNAAAAWKHSYDDLSLYDTKLEGNYRDLFNVKATAVRSWKCVKMWRCSKKKISAPDPATLHRPAVQTSAVVKEGNR